jgi:activating signal cointegrator 1
MNKKWVNLIKVNTLPHASLIPLGLKRYETRSWGTNYRGPLVICSAKRDKEDQFYCWIRILKVLENDLGILKSKPNDGFPLWDDLPFGCAIALVDLTDCIKMTPKFIAEQSESERLVGDWQVDRFAWRLENIKNFANPIPVRGKQGLFAIDVDLKEELEVVA